MVGVATIFHRKTEQDQHWSIPPTWPEDAEATDEDGEP
jgi:hypothetical protein